MSCSLEEVLTEAGGSDRTRALQVEGVTGDNADGLWLGFTGPGAAVPPIDSPVEAG